MAWGVIGIPMARAAAGGLGLASRGERDPGWPPREVRDEHSARPQDQRASAEHEARRDQPRNGKPHEADQDTEAGRA